MKSTICVVLMCSVLAIDADHISNCSAVLSCDACLAEPTCAWCYDPQTVSTPRCFHQPTEVTSGSNCREEYTYNPSASAKFLKAKDFAFLPSHSSSISSSPYHHYSDENYITPEHVRASMRIGSKIRLRIMYAVNEDLQNQSLDISLADNSSNSLSVKYFTKCLTEAEIETNKCHGVKVGDGVIYTIQLELLSCPANSNDWNQKLQIRPENLNGQLIVDLNFFCSCPIEMQGCSGNGHIVNGVCQCNGNYFGDYCECVGDESPSTGCRANDTMSVDCSDRGTCICGQCECHVREDFTEKIYGEYCECDNFSCDVANGLLCSGRGPCVCGQCLCPEGWSGSSCNCSTSTDTCISPTGTNQQICSGHGECKCGQCQCSNDKDGQYCTAPNESTKLNENSN